MTELTCMAALPETYDRFWGRIKEHTERAMLASLRRAGAEADFRFEGPTYVSGYYDEAGEWMPPHYAYTAFGKPDR